MASEVKLHRSLPPLVEGKVHGCLRLVIDEVVWSRKSPGEVTVLASWWGESDSAQFRPVDIKTDIARPSGDITEVYTIKTNAVLFKEYLKNCDNLQLVVYTEDTHQVIGTAQVGDLLDILENKPYYKYVPILNSCGAKIGDLHIAIKLLTMTRDLHSRSKVHKLQKKRLAGININGKYCAADLVETETSNDTDHTNLLPIELNDRYKSAMKTKRKNLNNTFDKFDAGITDKLVAQVVARAQRLRGAILKETCKDDPLALSENSCSDGLNSDTSLDNEATLYEYFLGNEMSRTDEKRALSTLRSVSPTQSLIDLASNTISSCKWNNVVTKVPEVLDTCTFKESSYRENQLLNRVDSIRIFIDSFVLSSAGFRRVKSSSVIRSDSAPKPVTYFVQYDMPLDFYNDSNGKSMKNRKPIKIYSKKQVNETIYFNHEAVFTIPKLNVNVSTTLLLKIMHRHLNQRLPSELGSGELFIKDVVQSPHLSCTQRVAIVNKGIKTGELKVTVELGCDCLHFGKQFVDALMSAKENIPLLEVPSLINTVSDKHRTVTGTHSKSNSRVSSTSTKKIDYLNSNTNTDIMTTKNVVEQRQTASDNSQVDVQNPNKEHKNKVLLHGLIYVAEGHDLPELNTYLICRAFWPEDKAASKICNNTNNPVYNFCQQVPLIHGTDLLERVKNNYVIIEVYSKSISGVDNLLGIAKLSLHQLYIAYRDPLVLPHLLLSQYPVISVDGWVPISDPVTGQSCGQLLALVALGTAEQIARLEITRGLRDTTILPPSMPALAHKNGHTNFSQYNQTQEVKGEKRVVHQTSEPFRQDSNVVVQTSKVYETQTNIDSVKSQECQTDISTVREIKTTDDVNTVTREDAIHSDSSVLHALVDRLAQALNVPKTNTNQSAQTETEMIEDRQTSVVDSEHINRLDLQSFSDDSEIGSPRNDFEMPAELYRSVGVGAEYDETVNQAPSTSCSNPICDSPPIEDVHKEHPDLTPEDSFKVLIEIECALHLPKMEKHNQALEPSTYVTFQKNPHGGVNHFNSCMITNVYPHSCDPRWDWKCETRLPTDLLLNDAKRLILKVWRLFDPDRSLQVNLEKDIVLGFSSIDLSVLLTGFPMVSGWFHIIDFTGRCNGQLKVNITPLENLSSFGKSAATSVSRLPVCSSSQSSWSPTYTHAVLNNLEINNESLSAHTHPCANEARGNEHESNNSVDFNNGFDNVSMSFLSLSLKQKLTELDEITKRLQSRLRDVTSTAFEDEFDNDFDLNEPLNDVENNDNMGAGIVFSKATVNSSKEIEQTSLTNGRYSTSNAVTNNEDHSHQINKASNQKNTDDSNNSKIHSHKTSDTGYSTGHSNLHSNQKLSNERLPDDYASFNDNSTENSADYPVRGTRTHISYLLDKLTLQFPPKTVSPTSLSTTSSPMRKNVIDLLSSLRVNNNQQRVDMHCNQRRDVRAVPTQTENEIVRDSYVGKRQRMDTAFDGNDDNDENKNISSCNKISDVIREELIADDVNDSMKCDDLSSYLITSNVRHMDANNFFNPLLYQHLVPHIPTSTTVSPEGEAVEQLDNRYAKTFSSVVYSKYSGVRNPREAKCSPVNESDAKTRNLPCKIESLDGTDHLRLTPSGVSENIDGNIDLTVVHKSSNQDLMDGNSTESTTTVSFDKSSQVNPEMEMEEIDYSVSSGSPVSTVSRQAPDGGNPTEEPSKPVTKSANDSEESSSTS